ATSAMKSSSFSAMKSSSLLDVSDATVTAAGADGGGKGEGRAGPLSMALGISARAATEFSPPGSLWLLRPEKPQRDDCQGVASSGGRGLGGRPRRLGAGGGVMRLWNGRARARDWRAAGGGSWSLRSE